MLKRKEARTVATVKRTSRNEKNVTAKTPAAHRRFVLPSAKRNVAEKLVAPAKAAHQAKVVTPAKSAIPAKVEAPKPIAATPVIKPLITETVAVATPVVTALVTTPDAIKAPVIAEGKTLMNDTVNKVQETAPGPSNGPRPAML